MPHERFEGRTCSAPPERSARMAAIVSSVVAADARDLLDLGCGTGRLAQLVADAHPRLRVVGIDISAANVAAANDANAHANVRFEQADYLSYRGGPFDVIVTDGVLHLIPGSTEVLIRKLAADLRPGGTLVCGMPFDCAYNRAFRGVRTILRAVRARWIDEAILAVGRRLHGATMSDEQLRERVDYMYLPPERLMTRELRDRIAARAGLRYADARPMPSVSLAQLRHNVTIFRKDISR